jgi:hypothetical protein
MYLRILGSLVPREMKVDHSQSVEAMTDEELERGIEMLTAAIQARATQLGDDAKVVEGVGEPAAAPPAPKSQARQAQEDGSGHGRER